VSPGQLRPSSRLISVAAGFLAATLATQACDRVTRAGSISSQSVNVAAGNGGEAIVLPTRWLVPPDPDLNPPLATPVDIAADESTGRLLVLELQPPELRSYSLASGALVEVMGREGDGPGEYRHPIGVAVNADALAAVLSVDGRVTFWRDDGAPAGVVQSGPGLASEIMAALGDTFYVKSDLFPPNDFSEFRSVTPYAAIPQIRYRDVDLLQDPARGSRNQAYAVTATPSGDLLLSPPGPDYVVLRISPGGEISQKIERREIAALERDGGEIAAIRERVRKGFAAAGRPPPAVIPVARFRQHLARLSVAPDGTIWGLTHRGDGDMSVIDCFGSDGRYAATYAVGLRVTDIAVTSELLLLLARGDYDVYGVAVARRPARPDLDATDG
jgi:hypothetical protein